jgi:hypothetical protein
MVIILAPTFAMAAYNGNDLYQGLKDIKTESKSASFSNMGYASGCVAGAVDALGFSDTHRVCLPSEITNGQLNDITLLYLESHPENRHWPAVALVIMAMGNKFPAPCPKK